MPDAATTFWWVAPTISLLGAGASWVSFIVSLRQRRTADRLAVEREYAQLGDARERFWTSLREAYGRFRRAQPSLPGDLDALIGAAGVPPGLPRPSGRHLRTWASENKRSFGPDQRALWNFSCAVYPARDGRSGLVTDHSSVDSATAVAFHQARGDLARFWNAWLPAIGLSWTAKRFQEARLQIIMLSWLESSLIRWTQDDGEGKKNLFRLAMRISCD